MFSAKKGEKYTFTAVTRSQGSPADLVLEVLNTEGKAVGQSDDAGTEDAVLNITIPADGEYTLSVEDLHGRGGSAFAYRVAVSETKQGFVLEAAADEPGLLPLRDVRSRTYDHLQANARTRIVPILSA